jgi:hypothetical protein
MTNWTPRRTERRTRLGPRVAVIVVVWLLIGLMAAAQRHYFRHADNTACAKASTTVVTVLAGPLNYAGVNPRTTCHVPQPSR